MSAIRPMRLLVLAALLAAPAAYSSDTQGVAARGQELFMTNGCPACHGVTTEDNAKVGPNLVGVLGRKAAYLSTLKD
jgi:cytochrome c2